MCTGIEIMSWLMTPIALAQPIIQFTTICSLINCPEVCSIVPCPVWPAIIWPKLWLLGSDSTSIVSKNMTQKNKKSYYSVIYCDKYLVKPIDVEIVNARHTLIAGREVELICESRGSRPPAQLTWFKDNLELSDSR